MDRGRRTLTLLYPPPPQTPKAIALQRLALQWSTQYSELTLGRDFGTIFRRHQIDQSLSNHITFLPE